jgi:hypothetical protein
MRFQMSTPDTTCPIINKNTIDNVFAVISEDPNNYFYRKNSMEVVLVITQVLLNMLRATSKDKSNIQVKIVETLQQLKNTHLSETTVDNILRAIDIRESENTAYTTNNDNILINHINSASRLNSVRNVVPIFQYCYGYWKCGSGSNDISQNCKVDGKTVYSFEESIDNTKTLDEIKPQLSNKQLDTLIHIIVYGFHVAYDLNITNFELDQSKIRFRDLGKLSLIRLGSSDKPHSYMITQYVPLLIDFSSCKIHDLYSISNSWVVTDKFTTAIAAAPVPAVAMSIFSSFFGNSLENSDLLFLLTCAFTTAVYKYGSREPTNQGITAVSGIETTPLLNTIDIPNQSYHGVTYNSKTPNIKEKTAGLNKDLEMLSKMLKDTHLPNGTIVAIQQAYKMSPNIIEILSVQFESINPNIINLPRMFCLDDDTCDPGFVVDQSEIIKKIMNTYEGNIKKLEDTDRQNLIISYLNKLRTIRSYLTDDASIILVDGAILNQYETVIKFTQDSNEVQRLKTEYANKLHAVNMFVNVLQFKINSGSSSYDHNKINAVKMGINILKRDMSHRL